MRLLNTETRHVYVFNDDSTPSYAILSHCWGSEEVLLADLNNIEIASQKAGFAKVQSVCQVASALGAAWLWLDTICIDQSSGTELSDAVNSHFRWFRDSEFCIAYLDDIDQEDKGREVPDQLRECRWM